MIRCNKFHPVRSFFLVLLLFSSCLSNLYAEDINDSQDHPLISRFKGANIIHYEVKDFDEYKFVAGKITHSSQEMIQTLEGKIFRIAYNAPESASPLEIYKSYEEALKSKKFNIIYSCSKRECGEKCGQGTFDLNPLNLKYGQDDIAAQFGHGDPDQQRFISAETSEGPKKFYVSMFVTNGWRKYPAILLDIIEVKSMDKGSVTVTPDAVLKDISEKGYASIYGINFDTGQSKIKEESYPVLGKIAEVLQKDPALDLYVVGNTDDTGDIVNNMTLSLDRAKAIVEELVKNHQISPDRLQPHGIGPLAPVATNTTDEGRFKNRRVDLVQRLRKVDANAEKQKTILEAKELQEKMKKEQMEIQRKMQEMQKKKEEALKKITGQ